MQDTTRSRTALVTGASKGIGAATCLRLANKGYEVYGLSRSKPGEEFRGTWIRCDLSNRDQLASELEALLAKTPIDCLVNNAAWPFADNLDDLELDKLNASLDFHVRSTLQTMQAVIPGMKERRHGRVVNLLTTLLKGSTGRSAYRAAKAGVMSLTVSAALEYAEFGITVNGVAPVPTATDAFYDQNPPGSEGEAYFISQIPMSRMGRPDEVAAAIEFFLGEDASFITGQLIYADGGMSSGRRLG